MESADVRAMPDRRESPDSSVVPPATAGPNRALGPLRAWGLVLGAALVAGFLSWGGVEATRGFFKPRLVKKQMPDGSIVFDPTLASQKLADTRNNALASGIEGGLLALAMGLVGGLLGRSPARGLAVGLVAMMAGALAGALATARLFPIIYRDLVPDPNDLLTPLLVQAGIWMAIGAVAGLALAFGSGAVRRMPDALWGSILGGFLAAGLYRLLHGMLSPASSPTVLVALEPTSRLLAVFCLTGLVSVGAARGAIGKIDRADASAKGKVTGLSSDPLDSR